VNIRNDYKKYGDRRAMNEEYKNNQFKNTKPVEENRINLEVFLKCQ